MNNKCVGCLQIKSINYREIQSIKLRAHSQALTRAAARRPLPHAGEVINRLVGNDMAMGRKPMYMQDWIAKLDDFIRFNERELLTHAGKISHQQAIDKAHAEYEKYRALPANEPSQGNRVLIRAC